MARIADPLPLAPVDLPVISNASERADARRNREAVLCAARRLFAEHGVENVSMDAVASAAGVGKGTLFRRFGDRAGLARALLQQSEIALQEGFVRGAPPLGPGAPPTERLKAFGAAMLQRIAEHTDVLFAAEAGMGRRHLSAPYRVHHLHVRHLLEEADPEYDAWVLADMLLAPLTAENYVHWVREGMEHDRIVAAYETLVDRALRCD